MSRASLQFQTTDSTGQVVGGNIGDCAVGLHGWMFSNSSATAYQVDIYVGTAPAVGSGNVSVKPSASTTKIFSIQVPANSSKEFFAENGIVFRYGIFAKASNVAVTGGLLWS